MSQKYLDAANKWIGTKEVPGAVANKDIVMFSQYTSYHVTSDEIPWCSQFANFIVKTCGDRPTGSAAARSWLDWGKVLDQPSPGCVVIIDRRDANNPNAAHVTFYVGPGEKEGTIVCVGGNQSDMVKESTFLASKVIGYRDVA